MWLRASLPNNSVLGTSFALASHTTTTGNLETSILGCCTATQLLPKARCVCSLGSCCDTAFYPVPKTCTVLTSCPGVLCCLPVPVSIQAPEEGCCDTLPVKVYITVIRQDLHEVTPSQEPTPAVRFLQTTPWLTYVLGVLVAQPSTTLLRGRSLQRGRHAMLQHQSLLMQPRNGLCELRGKNRLTLWQTTQQLPPLLLAGLLPRQ